MAIFNSANIIEKQISNCYFKHQSSKILIFNYKIISNKYFLPSNQICILIHQKQYHDKQNLFKHKINNNKKFVSISRMKPTPKQKSTPPPSQTPSQTPSQAPLPPAVELFSKTRDLNSPYHLDGNIEMYSQQNLSARQKLLSDPDIQVELDSLLKLYTLNQNEKISQKQYKKMQKKIALILRPDIEEEELEFVVDQDWRLDSEGKAQIGKEEMKGKIYELVDVWTTGVDRVEYIGFLKILTKKLSK